MTLDSFSYLPLPHTLGLPPMFSLSTRIEPSKPVGLVRKQIYTAHQHSYKPKFFIVQVQPKSVNKQNRLIGYEEYQNLHSDQILWRERERERERERDFFRTKRTCLSKSYAKRTTFFRTQPVRVRMKCLLTDVAKPLCVFHATCSHLTLGDVDKGFIDRNSENTLISLS